MDNNLLDLPPTVTDNEFKYLTLLAAIIEYSNPDSEVVVTRNNGGMYISISPNNLSIRQDLIDNLLGFHRVLHMKIKFSSSLAISKKVQFNLVV